MEEEMLYRAKQKALALLSYSDRTEQELRNRLKKEEYSDDAVEEAIAYVKSFHYLDDLRFAGNFIRSKSLTKSSREIRMLLEQKGVDRELIDLAYEGLEEGEGAEASELEAIRRLVAKKTDDAEALTREEKRKLCASLCRKGFRMENIRKVFRMYEEEC